MATPPKYRLRPYHPTDLPAISDISALGSVADALTVYMRRGIHKYWTSYRAAGARSLKGKVAEVDACCQVVEDPASGTVIGWAVYTRHGKDVAARGWRSRSKGAEVGMGLERALLKVTNQYYERFPGVDPTQHHVHMKQLSPIFGNHWDKEIFKEYWELDRLYVHPEYYRRGIGRMLIMWVAGRAGEEGVPVVVLASPMGKPAYMSCGFKLLERAVGFDQYIEEYRGGGETEGIWKLVWEPEGGDWLERAKMKIEERNKKGEEKEGRES